MRAKQPISRLFAGAALAVITACRSSSDATAPKFPALAGTYATTFTTTFSNSVDTLNAGPAGTITLNQPDGGGNFSGSYIYSSGSASGTIAGTLLTDGDIYITQFGDPNQSTAAAVQALRVAFWWCDFSKAAGSPISGTVSGTVLTLSGSITMPCYYDNEGAGPPLTVPSRLALTISGRRS